MHVYLQGKGADIDDIDEKVVKYTVQHLGLVKFQKQHRNSRIDEMKILVPATAHYSWDKMATLLGLCKDSILSIELCPNARMLMADLKKNLHRLNDEGKPVMMVVNVMGTTEESSVDPLSETVDIRAELNEAGLNFWPGC